MNSGQGDIDRGSEHPYLKLVGLSGHFAVRVYPDGFIQFDPDLGCGHSRYALEHKYPAGDGKGQCKEEFKSRYPLYEDDIELSVGMGCIGPEFESAALKGFVHKCGEQNAFDGSFRTSVNTYGSAWPFCPEYLLYGNASV